MTKLSSRPEEPAVTILRRDTEMDPKRRKDAELKNQNPAVDKNTVVNYLWTPKKL